MEPKGDGMRRFVALAAAFTFAVLQFAVRPAGAAVVTESGDAGNRSLTAQSAIPVDPLTQITGTLDGRPDEDLYRICIAGGGTFSATTEGTPGTLNDTQLFLFDESGLGVYANDDTEGRAASARRCPPATPSRRRRRVSTIWASPAGIAIPPAEPVRSSRAGT